MSVEHDTGATSSEAWQKSLFGALPPVAQGPGPDVEALRTAYLDLLKLTLTDLAHTTTVSVVPLPGGGVVARELSDDLRRLRSAGMDWPLQGLTMGGLRRLTDLQACITSLVADNVPGDIIEAGAWRGGSSLLIRATLDSLGDPADRTLWVADSFEGFVAPEDDEEDRGGLNAQLSAYDFLSISLEVVQDNFRRLGLDHGLEFLKGYFQETLPPLAGKHQWALIRLDGDTFEATDVTLRALYADLAPGGYVVIDDYGVVPECREAVDAFRAEHDITAPIEAIDFTCARWRRPAEDGATLGPSPVPPPAMDVTPPADGSGQDTAPTLSVPTAREAELRDINAVLAKSNEELVQRVIRRDALLIKLMESKTLDIVEKVVGLTPGQSADVTRDDIRTLLLSGE